MQLRTLVKTLLVNYFISVLDVHINKLGGLILCTGHKCWLHIFDETRYFGVIQIIIFFWLIAIFLAKSYFFCYLERHAKIQNRRQTHSRRKVSGRKEKEKRRIMPSLESSQCAASHQHRKLYRVWGKKPYLLIGMHKASFGASQKPGPYQVGPSI